MKFATILLLLLASFFLAYGVNAQIAPEDTSGVRVVMPGEPRLALEPGDELPTPWQEPPVVPEYRRRNPYADDIICELKVEYEPGSYELMSAQMEEFHRECFPGIDAAVRDGVQALYIGETNILRWVGAKTMSENEAKEYALAGNRAAVLASYAVHTYGYDGNNFLIQEVMGERRRTVTIVRYDPETAAKLIRAFQEEALQILAEHSGKLNELLSNQELMKKTIDELLRGQTRLNALPDVIRGLREEVASIRTTVEKMKMTPFIAGGYACSSTEVGCGLDARVGVNWPQLGGDVYLFGGAELGQSNVFVSGRHDPLEGSYMYAGVGAEVEIYQNLYIALLFGSAFRELNHPNADIGHKDQAAFARIFPGFRYYIPNTPIGLDVRGGLDMIYVVEDRVTHGPGKPKWGLGFSVGLVLRKP